jgi:poly(A) polymerase
VTAFVPADAYRPARTVESVPWMEIPGVRAVVWALGRKNVRFVGGCVRDWLCGRPSADVDIATVHPPQETLRRLQQGCIRAKPIGIEHGTVTAITDTGTFEITTLRRDIETDGRHARVAFTDDWAEDAARRDFTINAISVTPDGELFDPAGGMEDLEAGRVRFIGQPAERIREDVLRILRFFRFTAWYGRAAPDAPGVAACAAAAGGLQILPGERISNELHRMLAAPNPYPVTQAMADHAILRAITPLTLAPKILARLVAMEQAYNLEPAPLCRLAVLLPGDADSYAVLAQRLRFSKAESNRLIRLARPLPELGDDEASIRQSLYRVRDREIYTYQTLVAAAEGDRIDMRRRLHEAATWAWPELPVNGLDMIEMGVPAGPTIGVVLNKLEAWWVRRNFEPDRAACLDAMREAFNRST